MPDYLRRNMTPRIARMLRELEGPRSAELHQEPSAPKSSGNQSSRRDKRVQGFGMPTPAGARRR